MNGACVNLDGSESWQVLVGGVSGKSLCPWGGVGEVYTEGFAQREGGVLP